MNAIITKLRKLNIELQLVDSRLRINAPEGVMNKELLEEIKENKEALIQHISNTISKTQQAPLVKVANKAYYNLAPAQNRLYYLYEFDNASLAYNTISVVKLNGPLDKGKLAESFKKIVNRHDAFRTSFTTIDGLPVQKVAGELDFAVEEFTCAADGVDAIIHDFVRPFDLGKAPLIRVGLVEITGAEYVLMVDMHHIISDGTSIGVLIKDFIRFYEGAAPVPVDYSYIDYADSLSAGSYKEKIAKERAFWLNKFSGELNRSDLPKDFSRPLVRSYRGASIGCELNSTEARELAAMAEKMNCSLFMVVMSVYNILLSKLSNTADIVVGIPVSNRPHADLEDTIGMFVNTLAMRSNVSGDLRFSDFLSSVKTDTLGYFEHQAYQYEDLISDLKLERDSSRNPLFDVMLAYQNFELPELAFSGVTMKPWKVDQTIAKFDLVLQVEETPGNLRFKFDYSTDIFRADTIERFAGYFRNIVTAVLANPSICIADIDPLSKEDTHQLLHTFNDFKVEYPLHKTLVHLFEEQVNKNPGGTAVVFGDEALTYAELNEKANVLAHYLRNEHHLGSNDFVAIMTGRSNWLMVSIMGVLKAGAAYVPIDREYPASRKSYMLEDSKPGLLITDSDSLFEAAGFGLKVFSIDTEFGLLPQSAVTSANPGNSAVANDLAYVIYTSGSTGKPKGVMVEHRSIVNTMLGQINRFELTPEDHCLQFSSASFDASVWDIFLALLGGSSLYIIEEKFKYDVERFVKYVQQHQISFCTLPPAFFNLLPVEELTSIKKLVTVGEQAIVEQSRKFSKQAKFINGYGPTECSVCATVFDGAIGTSVPIGKPIDNAEIYILDNRHKLLPLGVAGEMYIGGDCVTRGYLNREDLTREKFVDNPYRQGERMYKTGDLARWLPDGNIEYLGRLDDQVKIRGFRIELDEINACLSSFEGIKEAVVVVKERSAGDKYLVAYYVSEEVTNQQLLKQHLSSKLPDYMVPAYYVALDGLPVNSSGKVDKKALPAPDTDNTADYTAPVTAEEQLLAKIWAEVLGAEKVGVTDNFFSIGGDSIKSIQISSRMRSMGYQLSVKDIMASPTIAELCGKLVASVNQSSQLPVTGTAPLSPVQAWFYNGSIEPKNHFNQSVMLNFPGGISAELVKAIFEKVQQHHDALRSSFVVSASGEMVQEMLDTELPVFIDEADFSNAADASTLLTESCQALQSGIDLQNGPLMKLGLYHMTDGSRLLIVIHHLVVDGVSWRILFEDIENLYQQVQAGKQSLTLPLKTDSFQLWAKGFEGYMGTAAYAQAKNYWQQMVSLPTSTLPRDNAAGSNRQEEAREGSFRLDAAETAKLLTEVHASFNTQINDILLGAFLVAVKKQYGNYRLRIDLEGHGREAVQEGININRTVGWFTSIYPVILETGQPDLKGCVKHVKESLRSIPQNGIDYLVYKYLDGGFAVSENQSAISFNYLGQFDADIDGRSYAIAAEPKGDDISVKGNREYDWDISGMVSSGCLDMSIRYSGSQYSEATINQLMGLYKESLQELIDFCCTYGATELTPSDLSYKNLEIAALDSLQAQYELEDIYPLSPMQQGMLFHSLYDADASHYFEQMACRLNGTVDAALVEQTMNELVARYTILRTVFLHEGYQRPLQMVLKERNVDFCYHDITAACLTSSPEEVLASYRENDRSRKFDLTKDALMRLAVLKKSENEHDLIWSYHHILMDGWCMSILVKEFMEIYAKRIRGEKVQLPAAEPYAKYINWIESRDKKTSANYWKEYLSGYDSLCGLPEKAGTAAQDFVQESHQLEFGIEETAMMQQLSAENGVTINTIIQCAWGMLLSGYNNTNDVVFGSVVSGRPAEIDGIESMVGLFINTVPVRVSYSDGESIGELLKKTQKNALESDGHSYHSLAEIQSQSGLGRDLFNHIIVFENFPVEEIKHAETGSGDAYFEIAEVQVFEQTSYDLTIMVIPGDTVRVRFNYNANKYDASLIERTGQQLQGIVSAFNKSVQSSVAGVDIVLPGEKEQLLTRFNTTAAVSPAATTVIAQFKQQLAKTPGNTAIRYGNDALTYSDFYDVSLNTAFYLINKSGVKQGDLVGVMLERDLYFVPVIYGILMAGAAYVPIDPNYPADRINQVLEESGVSTLVTRGKYIKESVKVCASVTNLDQALEEILAIKNPVVPFEADSQDLAYVIFTSGSTGKPKGVMIPHFSVVNTISCLQADYPLNSGDAYLLKTNYCFDVSVAELFGWYHQGGSLTVLPAGEEAEPDRILDTIEKYGITHLNFVPSMFSVFLNELEVTAAAVPACLRYVILAGEALPGDLVQRFYALNPAAALVNIYGPTEGTIYTCGYTITKAERSNRVHIGKPLSNVNVYILNRFNQLLPLGAAGELCISGAGVARGYHNNTALTNEKFIADPFNPGGLMYKTGDLARWLPDGNIEYLGRLDEQVKVRGFRIELQEISVCLSALEGIKEAVVTARERSDGSKFLVAYYVSETAMDAQLLRQHLSSKLPEYMVPAYYMALDVLPVTGNGKLDKKALPAPDSDNTADYTAPVTAEEQLLAQVWAEVLGAEKVGVTDNFFSIGGDSIKSIQISSRMRSMGYQLSVKDIMASPTIAELCGKLVASVNQSSQLPVTGTAPLSPVQAWFYNGSIEPKNHFNQSVMLNFPGGISAELVKAIFEKVQQHHDALRSSFVVSASGEMVQEMLDTELPVFIDEADFSNAADASTLLTASCQALQSGIDLQNGPLMKLGLYHMANGSRLLIVIHHLVVDGVSWRILFEDIESLYQQVQAGKQSLTLPLKTDSFQLWAKGFEGYMGTAAYAQAKNYWQQLMNEPVNSLPRDHEAGTNMLADVQYSSFQLSAAATARLLTEVHASFNTQINDILLGAFLIAVKKQYGSNRLKIDMEGHGREAVQDGININRTVGWFTSIYPVIFDTAQPDLKGYVKHVKESLRKVPQNGIDYLVYKYLDGGFAASENQSAISFNYLGQFDADTEGKSYSIAADDKGEDAAVTACRHYDWDISGLVRGGCLEMGIRYGVKQYEASTITQLMELYEESLLELIEYCGNYGKVELTPSDLGYKNLTVAALDILQQQYELEDIYPLSPMQQGMLFHSVYDAASVSYFEQMACQLNGVLDVSLVEQTVNELVARYTVLRTAFLHDGYQQPLQLVLKERKVGFEYRDVTEDCLQSGSEAVLATVLEQDRSRSFDLGRDSLMRLTILRKSDKEHDLIWSYHHILMDGWCLGILMKEFMDIYTKRISGQQVVLPAVVPYAKYIDWVERRDKHASAGYWKNYLSGYDNVAGLPKRAGFAGTGYEQKNYELQLSQQETAMLQKASAEQGVTINTIIQAAWGILLSKYNNTNDVVFGSVVSGRPAEIPGIESMIGLFINTVPVRVSYGDEESIGSLLKKIQYNALESDGHSYHSLAEIQSLSELKRDLFNHIMIFENFPLAEQIGGQNGDKAFTVTNIKGLVQTNYHFNIKVIPQKEITILFDFNALYHDENLVRSAAGQLKHIIKTILEQPEAVVTKLPLYDAVEMAAITSRNSINLETGITTPVIQELLAQSFTKHAGISAVEYRGNTYTYAQVEAMANKIANAITAADVPEGGFVGVLCEDRLWLIAALFGILKTRRAFVPLEVDLPVQRLVSIIGQAGCSCIVTDMNAGFCAELTVAEKPAIFLGTEAISGCSAEFAGRTDYHADDNVYAYFTSGSTGVPKGVAGRNKGLAHFVNWEIATFGINQTFRFGQFTNPGFDVFMRDIFVPVCAGATICIPDESDLYAERFATRWMDEQRISFIHCVPSLFRLFNSEGLTAGQFTTLRYILLAGEKVMPYELENWYKLFGSRIQLANIYGPTETTLAKGFYLVQPADYQRSYLPVTPMAGAQFLILDKRLNPCPPAATGEIYIRTPYRSNGYLNLAELNEQSFIQNPFSTDPGDRIYKTGDLGRLHQNGELEILGRNDHQVKIRGIRIELDDIKQNVLKFEGIKEAVIVIKEIQHSGKVICAYFRADGQVATAALRNHLVQNLPGNMLPSFYIQLDKFPLNANGKLNLKELPEPEQQQTEQCGPENHTEDVLAGIWADVLKMDKAAVSTTSSFFESGGHSIRAFNLMYGIQQAFSVKLKLVDIFRHVTIKEQALLIAASQRNEELVISPVADMPYYPVSPAQERMYYQHMLHGNSVAFNISMCIMIHGECDTIKIREAFATLTERHEGLRTGFLLQDDGVVQQVNKNVEFVLPVINITGDTGIQDCFYDFIRPFDLSDKSLFRAAIAGNSSTNENYLLIDLHHIIADGLSLNILIRDFIAIYQGATLQPLKARYIDYAGWSNKHSVVFEQQKRFWAEKLAGELQPLELPVSPSLDQDDLYTSISRTLEINGDVYKKFRQYAATADVSEFMLLLSVYYILLHKITGNTDIIIGTDVLGRTHPSLKDVVGTFINILPLRININEDTSCDEFLNEVRNCVLESFDNQDFQYDQMIGLTSRADEGVNAVPLVQVHLAFSNTIEAYNNFEKFEIVPVESRRNERKDYEFKLEVAGRNDSMAIHFICDPSKFDEQTVTLLTEYYQNILAAVLESGETRIGDIVLDAGSGCPKYTADTEMLLMN